MPTQSSSIDNTTTPGIDYAGANLSWTIAPGVLVHSRDTYGVRSSFSGSTLINHGNIFSGNSTGVSFTGGSSVIINAAGHSIAGSNGILVDGDGATITNHGRMAGYDAYGAAFDVNSKHVVLNNDGEIYGRGNGIAAGSDLGGPTINNSGLVYSDNFGVAVSTSTGTGPTTIIHNAAGGTIRGTVAAIFTGTLGAPIALDNNGTLTGGITCNAVAANDKVVNHGKILGQVHLGSGNDSFTGTGGTSGAVFGEDGIDVLKGGSHKDILIGGLGRDSLRGAAAADKFVFNAVLESVKGPNHDSILDFSHTQHDKINLSAIDANTTLGGNQAFHFIGSHAFGHHKGELRYSNHLLQGDTDGNGVADIEVHVNAAHLVAGDFVL
jgi:Ca2+-binding RTX toxin-like protein